MDSNTSLVEIKKWLTRGSHRRIAHETGLSESLVNKVMSGKKLNDVILDKAIEIAEENKENSIKRAERIKQL